MFIVIVLGVLLIIGIAYVYKKVKTFKATPGWKTDEVSAALESWVRAIESTGKIYREGIESWGESIAHAQAHAQAHAHSEREE